MSMYGERIHMEDWQCQLMERAKQVGPANALAEFHQVALDFCIAYWTEKEIEQQQGGAE